MRRITVNATHSTARRALAPLELILSLPFLMAVLALIINMGIEVKWKIQTLAVSRQAVWRQRPGRKGATDPQPADWPAQSTTLRVTPAPAPPLFPQDPFAQNAVVRGPVLTNPNGQSAQSQLRVDTELFDISGKVEQGNATIKRPFPLFQNLPGVRLGVDHLLADGQWRFQEMNMPSNEWRRILRIYTFDAPGNVVEFANQFQMAISAIMSFPRRGDLAVLDRDSELSAWYGPPPPDFHPWLRVLGCCNEGSGDDCCTCALNRFLVYDGPLQDLIVQIQGPKGGGKYGVPWRMADAFIRMYQSQLNQLKNQDPPDQSRINALQQLIDQLKAFQGTLY